MGVWHPLAPGLPRQRRFVARPCQVLANPGSALIEKCRALGNLLSQSFPAPRAGRFVKCCHNESESAINARRPSFDAIHDPTDGLEGIRNTGEER
jgi:hypothetical protein